jgi:PTH1 family peptidyl-tRNA hydrolase
MKIIFFQGNPGENYKNTRHNFAWRVADDLAEKAGAKWKNEKKFSSDVAVIQRHSGFIPKSNNNNWILKQVQDNNAVSEKLLLVKPTTFYNETGRAARSILDFYKLTPADALVVADDLNVDFGKVRARVGGEAGGNNGLKSLIDHLGTRKFARLRLGTRQEERRVTDTDFVLGKWTRDEAEKLPEIIALAETLIAEFARDELDPRTIKI